MAEVPVAFDLKFALVILSGGMTQGLKFVCLFVCWLVCVCFCLSTSLLWRLVLSGACDICIQPSSPEKAAQPFHAARARRVSSVSLARHEHRFFFLFILLIGMPVERRTGSFTSEALISRSSSLTQFDSQFRAESKRLDAVRYNQCGHGRWATSVGQRRWTGQASQMGTRKSQSRSKYQTWAQSCTSSKCARSVMFACL